MKKFIAFLKKLFSISEPKTNLNVNQHYKLKRSRGVLLPGALNLGAKILK